MVTHDDLLAFLDHLSKGNISEADLDLLRQHLSASGNQNTVQVGKYNVNIGQGQDIQIGDRIYQGVDAEALKETLRAILQESQLHSGKSEKILWQYRHTFRGHSDSVNAVIITSDSNTLISASDDKTIKVWSLNPPKPHLTFPEQDDEVTCIALTRDNQTLVSENKEVPIKQSKSGI
jgi:WD40 repeat protein